MTFIQPHTTRSLDIFRTLFITMLGVILAGIVAMVVLYNQAVAARHSSHDLHQRVVDLESSNAEAQQQLMAALDSTSLATFAAARGLVEDRAPEYLSASSDPWVFASRF